MYLHIASDASDPLKARCGELGGTRLNHHRLCSLWVVVSLFDARAQQERGATLARLNVHARLAAVRALGRRHLRVVVGSSGGKRLDDRAASLAELAPEAGASALAALAREDYHTSSAQAAAASASGKDPFLAGAASGAAAAAELLAGLDDWKLRTAVLRRLEVDMPCLFCFPPCSPSSAAHSTKQRDGT